MLGLYVHIPFCQALCSYCNFNRGLYNESLKTRYVAALESEITEAGDGQPADTVFFGGGTPSLLEPVEVERLLRACRGAYAVTADCEVTLETNPETVTPARLHGFLAAGVNRISFGVQSFDDDELRRLERVHSAARAADAITMARDAGFENLSLDLMLWLPGQSVNSWRRTVGRAIDLGPDHLSLYLLELYPNAPLKEAMARAATTSHVAPGTTNPTPGASISESWVQVAEDQAADMYLEGLGMLDEAGYEQYEISNVSRPGRRSRHNLKYWQSGAWRGFGCGAHTTMDGLRWQNVSATADYIQRVAGGLPVRLDVEPLSPASRIEEALFTGLRLTEGLDGRNFRARFGVDPWSRHGEALEPFIGDGLMWKTADRFGLTRRGMLVANEILALFV